MKKTVLLALAGVVIITLLVNRDIADSLILFLLVGAVPGTHYTVSPTFMLVIIASIVWLILFSLIPLRVFKLKVTKKKHQTSLKPRLPKQRFKEV